MKNLGFGLMRLPLNSENQTDIDIKMLEEMVDMFIQNGFTYFDTAYMYHEGKSEEVLRKVLVERHKRSSFTVASKLPVMKLFINKEGDQERIFAHQLEKCGLEYFDYYLLHNLGEMHYAIAEKFKSFDFLSRMKKEGKIKKLGFSFHDKAELLEKILIEHPETEFVQLQLNYMDWEDATIESKKCLEIARKYNKPVVVMEPIKGGTLTKLPKEAEDLFKENNPDLSIASWAIRFAASQEGVKMVLSGMSHIDQLKDNISYMNSFVPLNPHEEEVVKKAVEIFRSSVIIPCTACKYCTEGCPKKIPIPQYFALYNALKLENCKGFAIQQVYYANYATNHSRASECIECRQCEDICPQHIKISQLMKDVSKTFDNELKYK